MPTLKELQESFIAGKVIARALYITPGRDKQNLDMSTFHEELKFLGSGKLDGNHSNVERRGQRNRSATLLIPNVDMDLFHDVGVLYDSDKSTIRSYMMHDSFTTSPSPDNDTQFFNINQDKSKFLPIISREEFVRQYKEYRANTDGTSNEHTKYNEVLGNFFPESLMGLVTKSNSLESKLKLLMMKKKVFEKYGVDLPMVIIEKGKMIPWEPELTEVAAILADAKNQACKEAKIVDLAENIGFRVDSISNNTISSKNITPTFPEKASGREVINFISEITGIPKGGKFTYGIELRLKKIVNSRRAKLSLEPISNIRNGIVEREDIIILVKKLDKEIGIKNKNHKQLPNKAVRNFSEEILDSISSKRNNTESKYQNVNFKGINFAKNKIRFIAIKEFFKKIAHMLKEKNISYQKGLSVKS